MQKFKSMLVVAVTICATANSFCQSYEWAVAFKDSEHIYSNSIKADSIGNTYVLGTFPNTFDFDPGPGVQNLSSNGYDDIFLLRLDPEGNLMWAKSFGGTQTDTPHELILDNNGNIYLIGEFKETVDFDPGPDVFELTSGSGNYYNIFISKFDTSGNFINAWHFNSDVIISNYGLSIDIGPDGGIYSTGYFGGTVDFDPGSEVYELTANALDAFVCKLNAEGSFEWVKQITGSSLEKGQALKLDTSGNIYVTGSFQTGIDLDPGIGTNSHTAAGNDDMFIIKLDPQGDFIWGKTIGGSSADQVKSLAIDSKSNLIFTGRFYESCDFDPGSGEYIMEAIGSDAFILKLTSQGEFAWAGQYTSTKSTIGYDVIVNDAGEIYNTGIFQIEADISPDTGVYFVSETSIWAQNTFVTKLDSSGHFLWAKYFSGENSQYESRISGDKLGNLYTAAAFRETIDVDPGPDTFEMSSYGNSYTNVFIQKMATCQITDTLLFVYSCDESYILPWGQEVTENSLHYQIIPNSYNCDSVIGFNVTVNAANDTSIVVKACESYISPSGKIWNSTGNYQDTILNSFGCDSIIYIDLTIAHPSFSTIQDTACGIYYSPSGKEWINSGTYNDTLINTAGCDSIITVELVVNESSFISIIDSACNSYLSPSGTTWTSSGIYSDTLINSTGCDSIISISLTIQTDSYSTLSATFCDSYLSPGGKIWTNAGTYSDTIASSTGCDSIISITLEQSCPNQVSENFFQSPQVFPNPVNEAVSIDFGQVLGHSSVRLYNTQGLLLFQQDYTNQSNVVIQFFEIPGIYHLEVILENQKRFFFRLVK